VNRAQRREAHRGRLLAARAERERRIDALVRTFGVPRELVLEVLDAGPEVLARVVRAAQVGTDPTASFRAAAEISLHQLWRRDRADGGRRP
jgi:hypothetical protein